MPAASDLAKEVASLRALVEEQGRLLSGVAAKQDTEAKLIRRCVPALGLAEATVRIDEQTRATKARLASVASFDAWDALPHREKRMWPTSGAPSSATLAIARSAPTPEALAKFIQTLPDMTPQWVEFQLGPCPKVVRVSSSVRRQVGSRIPVEPKHARVLRQAGVRLDEQHLGDHVQHYVFPLALEPGVAYDWPLSVWSAHLDADAMLAKLVSDGRVTVVELPEEQARALAWQWVTDDEPFKDFAPGERHAGSRWTSIGKGGVPKSVDGRAL